MLTCWSFTVTGRGGLCMTGTGGLPVPRGTFLCRNLGGSIGSIGRFCEEQRRRQEHGQNALLRHRSDGHRVVGWHRQHAAPLRSAPAGELFATNALFTA